METKFDEIVETTSNIEVMKGKYLAERLLRSWNEDFIDEDTGEVLSVQRNEILLNKGTLLDNHNMTEINFWLQSGDITEVKLSNQKRDCTRVFKGVNLWLVSIELNSKKKTIYLYASSVENAIDIATDYIEQNHSGSFALKNLKELDYINLIIEESEEDEDEIEADGKDVSIYVVNVEITEDEGSYKNSFILKSNDVESAKKSIEDYLIKKKVQSNIIPEFEIKILQAKTIACNFIVDPEFSIKYFDEQKKKDEIEVSMSIVGKEEE